MSRLDDYRTALLPAHPDVSDEELSTALDTRGPDFPGFVIGHGLGPLWHERTGHDAFYRSRMQAEALFAMQERALGDLDAALTEAGIDYALIKGAANRLLVYDKPSLRACFDLDVLVRPRDRVGAAQALSGIGFAAAPEERSISRELVLSRGGVDVDLHWGLLREGRLRTDPVEVMLERRRRLHGLWMLGVDDALFVLLVHPAFAKHLEGWQMGLHRVADLLNWLRGQKGDWPKVTEMLAANGVRAAAWATLHWTQLLAGEHPPPQLQQMLSDLEPGYARKKWIGLWLRHNLSSRTSDLRWMRLLGFSAFLHDTPGDALRAARGKRRAIRGSKADTDAFRGLIDQ
jgi:hypothetical protein